MKNDIVFYYFNSHIRPCKLEALRCSCTGQAIAQYQVQRELICDFYRELQRCLFDPYPGNCTVVTLEARNHDFPNDYPFVTLHQLLHPLIISGKLDRLTIAQIAVYLKVKPPASIDHGMPLWIANCYFAFLREFRRNYQVGGIANAAIDETVLWCKQFLGGA